MANGDLLQKEVQVSWAKGGAREKKEVQKRSWLKKEPWRL